MKRLPPWRAALVERRMAADQERIRRSVPSLSSKRSLRRQVDGEDSGGAGRRQTG